MAYVFRRPPLRRRQGGLLPYTNATDGSANLGQAVGVGVAGSLSANPAALLIGVSGVGQAGSFSSSVVAAVLGAAGVGASGIGVAGQIGITPPGVQGVGIAGSLTVSEQYGFAGVAGIGIAHGITPWTLTFIAGVRGVGQAGSLSDAQTVGVQGAAGIGVAGAFLPYPQAFLFGNAVGVGIAGSITPNPASNPLQAAGVGLAGQITVTISGGGTSRKRNTGLEPVKKRPRKPIDIKSKVVLPPSLGIVAPPLAPAETSPIDDVEYAAHDLLALQGRIVDAEDTTAIARMLSHLDEQDERQRQDEADIGDVMAMLELTD